MKPQTIADIEQRLQPYIDEAGRLTGRDITIDRTLQLARLAGNPHERLRVVHVAGTSGKTSTSYYIAALLGQAGCRVGLTVSPHIDSITDRVQIDGRPLANDKFIQLMEEFLVLVGAAADRPTYFELMMVFSLWVFDRLGVDYAVIETGLGGLHDSSNICQRADKLAVITDIGHDHVHVLGGTLTEIAQQKLGIVHPENTVVMHRQGEEVMAVVQQVIRQQDSHLVLARLETVDDAELAWFQGRNWTLARAAYECLAERDSLSMLSEAQLVATQRTVVPGRMDVHRLTGKTVVIDGAHNQQKLAALTESFRRAFPDSRPLCIVAVKQGKDIEQMATLLAGLVKRVVLTTIEVSQDIPHQSVPMDEVADILSAAGIDDIERIASNQEAMDFALGQSGEVILVVGSLYLASTMRKVLRTNAPT